MRIRNVLIRFEPVKLFLNMLQRRWWGPCRGWERRHRQHLPRL